MCDNLLRKKRKLQARQKRPQDDWKLDPQPSTTLGFLKNIKIAWKKGESYEVLLKKVKELEDKINLEYPLAQNSGKDDKPRFKYVLEIVSLKKATKEVVLRVKMKTPRISNYETSDRVLLFGHSMHWEDSCDFDTFDVKLEDQN